MNIFSNVLFHIPHDSSRIPAWSKDQFVLSKPTFKKELILMRDSKTKALFSFDKHQKRLCARVSRLVVDVERFSDDSQEIMSQVGMGVIYTKTSNQNALRRKISQKERKTLLKSYYFTHHKAFYEAVKKILDKYGKCLIIDCHSFSSFVQDYEFTKDAYRPQICLGADDFHTPKALLDFAKSAFEKAGFEVAINTPFAGAITPIKFYEKDSRVSSLMIEVCRDLYMNEATDKVRKDWLDVKARINSSCRQICAEFSKDYF